MKETKFPALDAPLNPQERMMHAQIIRLDALCNMMSDFIEAYATVNKLGVEEVKVVEQKVEKAPVAKTKETKATPKRKPRKATPKVETPKE